MNPGSKFSSAAFASLALPPALGVAVSCCDECQGSVFAGGKQRLEHSQQRLFLPSLLKPSCAALAQRKLLWNTLHNLPITTGALLSCENVCISSSNDFAAASHSTSPSQSITSGMSITPAGVAAELGRPYKAQWVIFPSFSLLFPVFLPSAAVLPSFFLVFSHLSSSSFYPSFPSISLSFLPPLPFVLPPSVLPSVFPPILPPLCLYVFFLLPFHLLFHPSVLHSVLHSFLPPFDHASIPLFYQSYFHPPVLPSVCPLVSLSVPLSTHSFLLFILSSVCPSFQLTLLPSFLLSIHS